MALQLYVGNKNYSSWSMRPWVLMKQAGIAFEEVMVRFDSFDVDSAFKKRLREVNPLGKVPVLVDDGFVIWDTLAIAEYLAERFPDKQLWPTDTKARARARSVCAEMHSGFTALRNHCPMNIEASLSETGRLIWRDQAGVRADIWMMPVPTLILVVCASTQAAVARVSSFSGPSGPCSTGLISSRYQSQ